MERTLIKDLKEHLNKPILLQGWVQDVRNLSKIKFIILRDRSGDMQTVAFKGETEEASFTLVNNLTPESVVEINGIPKENKESRWGIEVLIQKISIISKSETPLPIDNSDKSTTVIDKRLDHRFLDTRNKKRQAIFKVRSKIVKILTNFFDHHGFTCIQTPKMTAIGVESGAELFKVDKKVERIPINKKAETMTHKKFTPRPFDGKIKMDTDEIKPVIMDEMHNRGMTYQIDKILAFANITDENVLWSCTAFLKGLGLLQAHIEDESSSILFMEKKSFFDIISFQKNPKEPGQAFDESGEEKGK